MRYRDYCLLAFIKKFLSVRELHSNCTIGHYGIRISVKVINQANLEDKESFCIEFVKDIA